jgi:3-hydroxyisobutyrate dehydrogenase-like beta-hydroxyacid dehydrogenase
MGHGMAKNLIEKGHTLTILGHRNRQPVEDLLERGAVEALNPAEVARNSEIVFICVPSSQDVESIIQGEEGLFAGAHEGLVVVDTTTADPQSTLSLAALLQTRGVRMADATHFLPNLNRSLNVLLKISPMSAPWVPGIKSS